MLVDVNRYLDEANKWVGTKEGSNKHKELLDIYNGQRSLPRRYLMGVNDAWCAAFVSAIAVKVGCDDVFPVECSCWQMEKEAGIRGYVINREGSQPGDFILYDWQQDGTVDHVGVIVGRDGLGLTVLEGNKNNAVGKREISVRSTNIRTVFRIPWLGASASVVPATKNNLDVARQVLRGVWGNGSDRVQRLKEAGYNVDVIQGLVNQLYGGAVVVAGDREPTSTDINYMVAQEVIEGKWGNGAEREERLANQGYDYQIIQSIVNSILK